MNQATELRNIESDFTNNVKIIGVGQDGEAVVRHISCKNNINADFFLMSSVTLDNSTGLNDVINLNIKLLGQDDDYNVSGFDEMEKVIGSYGIVFFICSIDDSTAIKTVTSISKKIKYNGILCCICSTSADKNNTNKKVEELTKDIDYMLFISTKDHFDSTCMTPEKFDVIANDFHKPLYSLTKLMEDDIVANHYDWAYFREFASSNKTTAFYSVVIRKEDDAQNHYKDIIHKTFNYETLSSINPMVIKHAMLHINAGENFKYSDYETIGNELVSLSKKDVPVIMGSSIDTELPKNVIQVSILLLGIEVIEGETITYEYESNRLEELLPVPEFLIKNTNK